MISAKLNWNWLSGSGEEDFSNSSMYFCYFTIISPCIVLSLVEIGSVVLEKKIFWFCQCIFHYFIIISPRKGTGPFIWTKLNPLHPRILCAKFGWNWLSGSGEDFLISSMYFHYFVIISPWKRAGSFIWTNLNPHHPRMFCAKFDRNWHSDSWELDFKVRQCLFAISLLSPLGNGRGPSFEQTWIPITLECFGLSFVEIGPVILENTIFKVRQCIFTIS